MEQKDLQVRISAEANDSTQLIVRGEEEETVAGLKSSSATSRCFVWSALF